MDKEHYKKLSIDFPIEEYTFLKLACAKQSKSMKDFVTESIMKSIDEVEAELDSIALKEAMTEENIKNAIPWSEVKKELEKEMRNGL